MAKASAELGVLACSASKYYRVVQVERPARGRALEELRTESEAYQLQWRQNEISELRAGHTARLVAIEEANALLRDQQCQVVVLSVLCCMPSLRLRGMNARSTPTVPRSEVRLRRHCRWPRKRS